MPATVDNAASSRRGDYEDLAEETLRAARRIGGYVRETPLDPSPWFSRRTGARVYLKLENLQYTASFKLRGAFNKLLTLSPDAASKASVAASSGNHGAAVACALARLGRTGTVFVPERTSPVKVEAIRAAGAEVRFFGQDGLETEGHARAFAAEYGFEYLSPYNDREVIAGQGTCGIEIARQLPDVDAVYVAVGGGGLIGGVGAYLKSIRPQVRVIGCQPAASPVMMRSVEAGRIVDIPGVLSLSDATAGGIEANAVTFDLCRALVDDWVLVSEEEIAAAMRAFIDHHHMLLEGAAGVALAGLLAHGGNLRGENAVAIICGSNISRETLAGLL